MDNKKYEALIHIAETGSITLTAELMGYTQSGITQMINSLERDLGVKLLTRTNKGTNLTAHGEKLLPLMREEHRCERNIRQECDRIAGKETGTVTVGCLASIGAAWMPTILQKFTHSYPDIKIDMLEYEAPDLERMLSSGRIDLAVIEIEEKKNYDARILYQDEIFAVVPENHELAKRDSIPLDELARYPFISYATGESHAAEIGWPHLVASNKIQFNTMYSCNNDLTALEMVRRNLGVTLFGNLILGCYPQNNVKAISLDPPKFRSLGIAVRSGEEALPATRSFINCIIENIGDSK